MRAAPSTFLVSILLLFVSSLTAQEPGQASGSTLYDRALNSLAEAGPDKDGTQAMRDIRTSATMGYIPAQVLLGSMLDTGSYALRDRREAADWYRKAGEKGDRLAQWLLGSLYLTGDVGARDPLEAERWFSKAAEQGDAFGEYQLGVIKEELRDYKGAIPWLRKAAEQGLPQAQHKLGLLLMQGQEIDTDKVEAYVWLQLSFEALRGLDGAPVASEIQQLEGVLSNSDIERAKSKAHRLQATYSRGVVAHGCTGWIGEFAEAPTPPPLKVQRFCH